MSEPVNFTREQLLERLRDSASLSDEDVAHLVGVYLERFTELPINEITIAGGLLMWAGRRITAERAEHLLEILNNSGLVEGFESGLVEGFEP